MLDICCCIKKLPSELVLSARQMAIQINPENHAGSASIPTVTAGAALTPDHLAVKISQYWGKNGVFLTVGFLDSPAADLKKRILFHMNSWGAWANVKFVESGVSPQVRIARLPGGGYWSYLGTDILSIPASEPTMNLDNFTMNTADSEFYRVVRHETGHTLGCPHEHMRAEIVNRIDKNKAIAYFGATQGWTPQEVTDQVLTPLDNSALLATAHSDINSIMCYWLPASIMKDNVAVTGGVDIDASDATFIGTAYPHAVAPSSVWPNGKVYFFKGSQYARYDVKDDKVDPGFPSPIAGKWPGFPPSFAAGIDAVLMWNNGKAYFFKGTEYLRYDIATDKTDPNYPRSIAANWPGLWTGGIDAGVTWNNGKAYFFKGSQYMRYDILADKVDSAYPRAIKDGWPGFPPSFAAGINAAFVWNDGKAYFFKGSQYIRYDIETDKVDSGYPKDIAGNWPGLWPSSIDA